MMNQSHRRDPRGRRRESDGLVVRRDVATEGVSAGEIVGRAAEQVWREGRLEGVELCFDFQQNAPPVLGDATRLQRVFASLLVDAAEESRRQGSKRCVQVRIGVGGDESSSSVSISVDGDAYGTRTVFLPSVVSRGRPSQVVSPGGRG